jgi:hypothetical protein
MFQWKVFTSALPALLLLSFSAAAQGQYPGGAMDPRQHGFQHGYRDGFERGRLDREQNLPHNSRVGDYRMADRGYEPYMGSHEAFVDGYLDGYRSGYEDGFNQQRGQWDRTYRIDPGYDPDRRYSEDARVYEEHRWGYQDVAYDIGYRDGVSMGQHDAARHKDFRPEKNDRYEDADHGYQKSYGDKNAYKARFREGFLRGYSDGYGRWR